MRGLESYADEPGFCRSALLEDVRSHGHALTPGRYVGAADLEDDGVGFVERFSALKMLLLDQMHGGRVLDTEIERALATVVRDA